MAMDLYYMIGCAACNFVRMVVAEIGVDLNLKFTDLWQRAHKKPEFLKMNPQRCLPTLNDNGFILWESCAIVTYLVDKYAKDDSLYPKDLQKRALINQRLFFNGTTLYPKLADYYYTTFLSNVESTPEDYKKIAWGYELLETYLQDQDYVAGNTKTIADMCILGTVSIGEVYGYSISKYENITKWFNRMKTETPIYDELHSENLKDYNTLLNYKQKREKRAS